MCFAPQRRALFRHLNFQKWSENGVLCTFWLGNVLRATTACTFSTSELPKVVREWCALYILTWKCASTLSLLLFSLLIFLFSLTLSISAFHLSILSEVWLLNFLRLVIAITIRSWLNNCLFRHMLIGKKPLVTDFPKHLDSKSCISKLRVLSIYWEYASLLAILDNAMFECRRVDRNSCETFILASGAGMEKAARFKRTVPGKRCWTLGFRKISCTLW